MLNFVLIRVLQKQGPTDGARRQPIPGPTSRTNSAPGFQGVCQLSRARRKGEAEPNSAQHVRVSVMEGGGARVALVALVGDEGGAALEPALGSRTKLHQNE